MVCAGAGARAAKALQVGGKVENTALILFRHNANRLSAPAQW